MNNSKAKHNGSLTSFFVPFLQLLVLKNEKIKKKESDFKQACKVEMNQLAERNQKLSDQLKPGSDRSKAEPDLSALQAKLDRLRQDLAAKSKRVGKLERQLDDVTSSFEEEQYLRRLYELVSLILFLLFPASPKSRGGDNSSIAQIFANSLLCKFAHDICPVRTPLFLF